MPHVSLIYNVKKKGTHTTYNEMDTYEAAAIRIVSLYLVTWVHTFQFKIEQKYKFTDVHHHLESTQMKV